MQMAKQPFLEKLRRFFEMESGYGTFATPWGSFMYFIKQGHIMAHFIDRVKFRWFPKFAFKSNFPSHLDVETSSACQMKCPMCYTTYMDTEKKGIMDFNLYKKIINEAIKYNVYSIKLSWRGEPMLNKNIVKMISYAKQSGICEVAMLSNAERLTPELAKAITDAGLDWISLSVDGNANTYNIIRAPAIFEETLEKIRVLREYRDKVGKKKPLIRIQSILSAIQNSFDEFISIWDGIADRVNFISDQARDFDVKGMYHDQNYVCPTPWQRMSISHNGVVHQCISDYNGYMIMGDVKKQSLYEIWHGGQFRKLRERFRKHTYLEHCEACLFCTDNVTNEKEEICVNGKKIKVNVYKGITKVKDKIGYLQR